MNLYLYQIVIRILHPTLCEHQEMKAEAEHNFLPKASIGLRVLSLPASVCPSISPSVCHQVCPRDNSSPIQARITKFVP